MTTSEFSIEAILKQRDNRADVFEKTVRKARNRNSFSAILMRSAGKDRNLRMGILQFIEVLPRLKLQSDIYAHYVQFVEPHQNALPLFLRLGSKTLSVPVIRSFALSVFVWLINKKLASAFIIPDERMFKKLRERYVREGVEMSIDFVGELVTSSKEAKAFASRYINAMGDYGGKEAPLHMAVKFSSLYPFFTPENYEESKSVVYLSFAHLLKKAKDTNSFITVDAEHEYTVELILDIFCKTILCEEFSGITQVGIALQAYRKDSFALAEQLVYFAKKRGTPFMIRLVKGAYWDTERALSDQKDWSMPLYENKSETDENFDKLCAYLMENWGTVYVSPATHNPRNIAFAQILAERFGITKDPNFYFQVLYGLGEPIMRALRAEGLPVLVYAPLGNLLQGMSYLARRILENTSNENFLFTLME